MKAHIIMLSAVTVIAALMISGCSPSKETEQEVKTQAEKAAGAEQAMPRETGPSQEAGQSFKTGEHLFKLHCAICHPDGGNIINPRKPLHRQQREAFGVRTAEDIVHLMRNPGPGMSKFDEATISGEDAGKIAEYVLKAF